MKVPVFFTLLVFILLGSNINSCAGVTLQPVVPSAALHSVKKMTGFVSVNTTEQATFSETGLPETDQLLICEDVEDDGGNDLSPKKYKSLTGIACISYFRCFFTIQPTLPDPLPFHSGQPSYRYILHRTLRI